MVMRASVFFGSRVGSRNLLRYSRAVHENASVTLTRIQRPENDQTAACQGSLATWSFGKLSCWRFIRAAFLAAFLTSFFLNRSSLSRRFFVPGGFAAAPAWDAGVPVFPHAALCSGARNCGYEGLLGFSPEIVSAGIFSL